MWRYTAIDKDGNYVSDFFDEYNENFKASEVCHVLELRGLEILSLRKIQPIEIFDFLYRLPKCFKTSAVN